MTSALDGCISLREEHDLRADDIEGIHLRVNGRALELTGKKAPQSGLEGKFSIYHSAAIAIIDGDAGEPQYADERVRDPNVVALRNKATAEQADELSETEAIVVVHRKQGPSVERRVTAVRGSLERPLSDRDVEAKARQLMSGLSSEKAEKLIELCWSVDKLLDVAELARTAAAG
jgi:2-methylcitrate dehydratase PrpD